MSGMSGGRRRAYRSRHQPGELSFGAKLVITLLVCGFVVFCAAIVLGNFLRRLAGEAGETTAAPADATTAEAPAAPAGNPVIKGKAVTFYSVLSAAVGTGAETGSGQGGSGVQYDSISILLRYPDPELPSPSGRAEDGLDGLPSYNGSMPGTGMIITYTSPVVQAVMAERPGSVGLRDGIAALKMTSGKMYTSGVFYLAYPSLSGSDRTKIRDYEVSLIYELFEYGINEVVLCGYGSEPEDVADAAEFVHGLKARIGDSCVLGVALPFDFFSTDDAYAKMRESGLRDAFFALDLVSVEVPGLMSPESLIYDRVQRIISLAVAYNLRIVVGCGQSEDVDSQVAEAIRSGAVNVQGAARSSPGKIYY